MSKGKQYSSRVGATKILDRPDSQEIVLSGVAGTEDSVDLAPASSKSLRGKGQSKRGKEFTNSGESPNTSSDPIVQQTTTQLPPLVPEPDVRLIAFYLPQFHPVPDNDRWWGTGFTEWQGVAGAEPLFSGHYQPHLPADLGFYDLRVPETRESQAALARQYGISGFCYHYYWFSGQRILERPLDEVLQTGKPDFPFCVCWANETWSRRWDGSESEVLIAQTHDLAIDKKMIFDLLPLFRDARYIKIEGRPLLIIYRIGLLPDASGLLSEWREVARQDGFPDLHICMAETFGLDDPYSYGCDAAVEFPPHKSTSALINDQVRGLPNRYTGNIYSFQSVVTNEIAAVPPGYPRYRCVMPGWDNTPRRGPNGNVFWGPTPELYELWLREMIAYTRRSFPPERRLVFVNAWNEWGEGAHLEPDIRFGREFLEATRRAVAGSSTWAIVMDGAKARFPDARETLDELEKLLKAYETSLEYLSARYLELEKARVQSQFVDRQRSALSTLEVRDEGQCNIERVNQFAELDMVFVQQCDCLHLVGWRIVDGRIITQDTESFITLLGQDGQDEFTVKIVQRIPRRDVAEHYNLNDQEGLWTGFRVAATLNGISRNTYRIAVDTVIDRICFRAVSTRSINVNL
jgi:glycosyl transferase family WbsX